MDTGRAEPQETIFNAAHSCLELFRAYLSEDRVSSGSVVREQQLFWVWSNNLKVFANPHVRLDAQLRDEKYAKIKQMVLLLLVTLKQNLSLDITASVILAKRQTHRVSRSIRVRPCYSCRSSDEKRP